MKVRQFDVEDQKWRDQCLGSLKRFFKQYLPTIEQLEFTSNDLPKLDAALDFAYRTDAGIDDEEFGDLSVALGVAFGEVMCREFGLDWCIVQMDGQIVPAVRVPRTERIFFVIDMVTRRMTASTQKFFSELFTSAGEYAKQSPT